MMTFRPSDRLVQLTNELLTKPDAETQAILDEMAKWDPEDNDITENLRQVIIEAIDGLCTSVAQDAYRNKQLVVNFTQNLFFPFDICIQLVDRCGLDKSVNLLSWFLLLQTELKAFLKDNPRQRCWGTLSLIEDDIVLSIKEHIAFWEPDYMNKCVSDFFEKTR